MNQESLIYEKLRADGNISDESIIKSIIEFYMESKERNRKIDGVNYYDSENTNILNRKEKDLIVNHKTASGFYKKLVDQKVSYCIGNDIVIENLPENLKIPNINDFIDDLAENASIKGVEWLFFNINKVVPPSEHGELSYKIIDSIECIPIFDTEFEDELQTMIRFYQFEIVDNNNCKIIRNKVEVYDHEKVTYYIEDIDHVYNFDAGIINPVFYNTNKYITMGEVDKIENFGWGEIPFIPLFNTKKAIYDLQNIKGDIDLYDIIKSDFANNIEQHQDSILVIINRGAEDYEDFLTKLKKYKIITIDDVSDVGGASYLTLEIPVEARKTLMEIIKSDIYEFGFGVDLSKMEGSITNIFIKSKYVDLDLKASKFIKQIKKFLKKYYSFANIYLKNTNQTLINVENLKFIFNKNILINESENIENIQKSDGIISKKTNISNHPYVDNIDDEIEQIEKEDADMKDENELNENVNNIDENVNDDVK